VNKKDIIKKFWSLGFREVDLKTIPVITYDGGDSARLSSGHLVLLESKQPASDGMTVAVGGRSSAADFIFKTKKRCVLCYPKVGSRFYAEPIIEVGDDCFIQGAREVDADSFPDSVRNLIARVYSGEDFNEDLTANDLYNFENAARAMEESGELVDEG